jgi:hypothetical protein
MTSQKDNITRVRDKKLQMDTKNKDSFLHTIQGSCRNLVCINLLYKVQISCATFGIY